MRNVIRYIYIALAALWLASCANDIDDRGSHTGALELTGLNAHLSGGATAYAASEEPASETEREPLYVGRKAFVANDKILMQKFHRTDQPINDFTYTDCHWEKTEVGSAWTRVTGETDKIYWSDAKSEHTFIGYSKPSEDFSWQLGEDGAFHGEQTVTHATTGDTIDYTDEALQTGRAKMEADDIVLVYDTKVVADQTGLATVDFRHALSCLTIDLNISGFSTTEQDWNVRITSLHVLNQPYQYKWLQKSNDTMAEDNSSTATIKAWTKSADGDETTSGRNRRFFYHTLIVPGTRPELDIEFTVQSPDPNNTAKMKYDTYIAHAKNIELLSAKRTTLRISLNHADGVITMGAEYQDWEYVETPIEGNLSKNATFLQSTDRNMVRLHDDKAILSRDDATWLYIDNGVVVDIYGNDGSEEHPYSIATANQLLAFAYEVNEGKLDGFKDKYVRLNGSLFVQPNAKDTKLVWRSIGADEAHPFKGHFDGGFRTVSRLYGASLFGYIAETAFVEGIQLDRMIGTFNGGSIAYSNAGDIFACTAEGNVSSLGCNGVAGGNYAGGICAVNTGTGTVSVCSHIGDVTAPMTAGGCAGTIAGYDAAGIGVSSAFVVGKIVGAQTTAQCYFDNEYYTPADPELAEMGLPTAQMMIPEFVDELNSSVPNTSPYKFIYRPSEYPILVKE